MIASIIYDSRCGMSNVAFRTAPPTGGFSCRLSCDSESYCHGLQPSDGVIYPELDPMKKKQANVLISNHNGNETINKVPILLNQPFFARLEHFKAYTTDVVVIDQNKLKRQLTSNFNLNPIHSTLLIHCTCSSSRPEYVIVIDTIRIK